MKILIILLIILLVILTVVISVGLLIDRNLINKGKEPRFFFERKNKRKQ